MENSSKEYTSINTEEKEESFQDMSDSLTFRSAMEELENTVAELEGNNLELEESLEKYKRGVELLTFCKSRLSFAQVQVEELLDKIEAENITDQERDTNIS